MYGRGETWGTRKGKESRVLAVYWALRDSLFFLLLRLACLNKKLGRVSYAFHKHQCPSLVSFGTSTQIWISFVQRVIQSLDHAWAFEATAQTDSQALQQKKKIRWVAALLSRHVNSVFLRSHGIRFERYWSKKHSPVSFFSCQQLVTDAGPWDRPRLGLTWAGFSFLGTRQVAGSLFVPELR